MPRCIFPIASWVTAADKYNRRVIGRDHLLKLAIRCRFASQGYLKTKTLHSTFHILPGNCTATTVNRIPLGILINIYRRSLIGCLRWIDIGHTTKSTAERTKFATVIIRLCPFPGPSQTFTPRLRPLQKRIHCILRFYHVVLSCCLDRFSCCLRHISRAVFIPDIFNSPGLLPATCRYFLCGLSFICLRSCHTQSKSHDHDYRQQHNEDTFFPIVHTSAF